jgi:hypothetical protein
MSEPLKHECGIALIRLRKPLRTTAEVRNHLYGINKKKKKTVLSHGEPA